MAMATCTAVHCIKFTLQLQLTDRNVLICCVFVSDIWILELRIKPYVLESGIVFASDFTVSGFAAQLYFSSLTIIFPKREIAMQSTVC